MEAKKGRMARVGKWLLRGVVVMAALAWLAHLMWVRSGSGEWVLLRDDEGIQIYSLKNPGSALLKFRGRTRVATSLTSSVFLYRGDESTNDDFGGQNFRIFDRVETPSMYMAYFSVEQPMPPPFQNREIVSLLNYAQDPETGEVLINVQAAPSRIPPTPDLTRVTYLNNQFRMTPMPEGDVQWEITLEVDMGLFYVLANLSMPDLLFQGLLEQRELVLTERYQQARLISVQEPIRP